MTFWKGGRQVEGTVADGLGWKYRRCVWGGYGEIQRVPEVSGVHPSNRKSLLRKVALSHPGDWVRSQAYPRVLLRPYTKSG